MTSQTKRRAVDGGGNSFTTTTTIYIYTIQQFKKLYIFMLVNTNYRINTKQSKTIKK